MKSKNIETTPPSNNAYSCGFCGRTFARERTVESHVCEQKRRWNDKDKPGNRIAWIAFDRFYRFNTNSKKKSYDDFVRSTYYIAFTKFGNYCVDVGIFSVERYVDWLVKNQIKITDWTSDRIYQRYLVEYLREEDALDAIARSIKTLDSLREPNSMLAVNDMLRWGNKNRICHAISSGKVSPWILYQSSSGVEFLNGLNQDQLKVIFDYINPELWAIMFLKKADVVNDVKMILKQGGF